MTTKAAFLLVVAAIALHLSIFWTALILFGYAICAYTDAWLVKKAKNKVIEDETEGWEVDPENSEWENKGGLTRVRLTGRDQIIVTRVANLLRRIA